MNKKFISIAMAMVLSISSAAFAASAAEVEVEESGDATGTIKFDMGSWNHDDNICFYIWDSTDGTFCTKNGWQDSNPWGSKKLFGTKVEGEDGIVESYEFSIPDGHDIFVIFHDASTDAQTYDCVLTANAFGDTAYLTGGVLENPVDSEKTCIEAKFQNASDCGPYRQLTSTGNIVGDYSAPNDVPADKVAEFVYKYLGQTEKLSGELIVTEATVTNAYNVFGTNADDVWASFQNLNGKAGYEEYATKEADAKKVINPTSAQESSDSDSDVSSNDNSSNGSSTGSSSGSKGTTSTSTTKTTSTSTTASTATTADAAATGDTTGTVAFAVVLLAAAAGIVATRKKIEE